MQKNNFRAKLSKVSERYLSVLFTILYLFFFMDAYKNYISIEWGYTGLLYSDLSSWEYLFIYLATFSVAYFLPTRLDRPSSAIIWLLTMMVFVPTLPLTFMTGSRSASSYYLILTALTIVLVTAGYTSDKGISTQGQYVELDKKFVAVFFGIFSFLLLVLYYEFNSILSFASIEETYDQRFLASEVGGGVIGYFRTYFLYVFTPFLFAVGLRYQKFLYLLPIGMLGYLFTYMIDASKIALVIPILMVGFFVVMRWFDGKVYYLSAGIAVLTVVSGQLVEYSRPFKIFADLVLLRSIAIPAQTFAQYADLFSARGYTWWSNVRFINLYVDPPSGFAADPNWPVLGRIVGTEYYGAQSLNNANANLFSGEGVAAAGVLGVLIIGVALIGWLIALDRASRGWDRFIALLLCVPLGMGLTNTHLSTLLLSFGGIFWLAIFQLYKPGNVKGLPP